jgi:hypothetical protein
MKMQLLATVTADGTTTVLTNTLASPFTTGNESLLMLIPNAAFDGSIQVTTDTSTDANDAAVFTDAFADTDFTTNDQVHLENITSGSEIRVIATSTTAGECKVYLAGGV